MAKRCMVLLALMVPSLGFADWVSEQAVRKWAEQTESAAAAYLTETAGVTEPAGFPGFLSRVGGFRDRVRGFKDRLSGGYSASVPGFRDLRQTYLDLKREYDANYRGHKNFRVRLGWQRLERAWLELEWAFTRGEPL